MTKTTKAWRRERRDSLLHGVGFALSEEMDLLDDADRAEELEQLLRDIRLDCCFVSLETLKRIDAALAPKPEGA